MASSRLCSMCSIALATSIAQPRSRAEDAGHAKVDHCAIVVSTRLRVKRFARERRQRTPRNNQRTSSFNSASALGRWMKPKLLFAAALAWTLSVLRIFTLLIAQMHGQSPIQAEPNSAKRGQARAKSIQENGSVFRYYGADATRNKGHRPHIHRHDGVPTSARWPL